MGLSRDARLEVAGAARAAHHPGTSSQNIKYRLPDLSGPLGRRSLFASLKLERQVIPAVSALACSGARGCGLCSQACPAQAIERIAGRATIIAERCMGCGACVPACPTGAVVFPGFTPDEQSAGLAALLSPEWIGQARPVVTFVAERAERVLARLEGQYPARALPVSVPSLASLGVADVLEALARGSAAVALIGYKEPGADHEEHRLAEMMDYVDWLVRSETEAVARVARFDLAAEHSDELMAALEVFCGHDRPPGPGPVGLPREAGVGPLRVAELVHAITGGAHQPQPPREPGWTPFGAVKVEADACTVCGVCAQRCPTGAIDLVTTAFGEQLLFQLDRCVACGLCADVCPERILLVVPEPDPEALGQRARELARAPAIRCSKCGERLTNLNRRGLHLGRLAPPVELCTTCRLGESLFPQLMN